MAISRKLLLSALIVSFGSSFQTQYFLTLYNVPQDVIEQYINGSVNSTWARSLSSVEISSIWGAIGACSQVGKVLAMLLMPIITDRIGRKRTFVVINIFCVVSILFQYLAHPTGIFILLAIGRLINGFYIAIAGVMVQLFLAEIAVLPRWRAHVTRITGVVSVLGNIFAFIVGLPELLGTSTRWGYITLIPLPVLVAETIWFFTVPETPMFQIQSGQSGDRVERSLQYYLGPSAEKLQLEKQRENISGWWQGVKEVWKNPSERKSMYLWIVLGLIGPFSGDSTRLNYLTSMISEGGAKFGHFAKYAALAIYCLQGLVVVVSLCTLNKFGRKPLLICTCWIVDVSLFALVAASFAQQYFTALIWVKIAFIVVLSSISCVTITTSTLIISESAQQKSRALALAVCKLVYHLGGLGLIFAWPPVSKLCEGGAYLIFAIPFLGICVYLTIMCPETKNIEFIAKVGKESDEDGERIREGPGYTG